MLSTCSLILYAIPSFWLGLVLSIVFAVQLRWLPTSGIETIASGKVGLARTLDIVRHLVLPVAALALIYMALFLRVMRSGMAEAWTLDFVLFARSKGLSRSRIVLRHVARNALLPLVTMLGLQSAAMLGGSVVIESIFAIPGFGRLAQEAVSGRDAPLLMGIIVVSAVLVICVNLLVDLVYAALDPRVGASEPNS
jgi:peptide/nickel transport system permease protein